ncbi:MAG: helix-turn-helix transcriptional regulator [Pseudomonadota bacterium]
MRDRIHDTILRVYDAAAADSLWPQVLQEIADGVDALGCIVFEWQEIAGDRNLGFSLASSYYDPAMIATYLLKCRQYEIEDQNVFESHSLVLDRIDLIEDDVIAANLTELQQRPNVLKLQKLGILHRAAGLLNKDNTAISRFSIQFGSDRGRMTTDERVFISTILPHVAKAFDLGRPVKQLAATRRGLIEAIDHLKVGVCVLDARGHVVIANNEFERQRDACRVFSISAEGRLRFSSSEDERRFQNLRAHALNHGHFGARPRKEAISTRDDAYLCIELIPLDKAEEIGSKPLEGFVMYSYDTSLPARCQTGPFSHAYELTDAESEIIDAIADGLTNAQIAERRERSTETVNSQVKMILSKTGCANRTQLVRLMMSFGGNFLQQ